MQYEEAEKENDNAYVKSKDNPRVEFVKENLISHRTLDSERMSQTTKNTYI